jgi:hypothetical protein
MGTFKGHALPGIGFLLVGIPLLIRCIDVSFIQKHRFNKWWILWEGMIKLIAGIL